MRRSILLATFLLATLAGAAHATIDCASGTGRGGRPPKRLRVVGLTADGRLVCFTHRSPERARTIGTVTGLGGGDMKLIGIDFRVQDGLLYGVGDAGGVYTLDTDSAAATRVSQLTMPLRGTAFGVDFNPAADRLRIVSDAAQNLRHNVNTGGVTLPEDGTLSYGANTPAAVVTGAGYTNNDLDPNTGTTLFDVDTSQDQVAVQSPPNNGNLVATGKLLVDAGLDAGFDVYSALDREGTTTDNQAYAALSVGGASGFYRVDLLTGAADRLGTFDDLVTDIALPLNQ